MNTNVKPVDLSKSEKKLYDNILNISSAADCDALINESLNARSFYVFPIIFSFLFIPLTMLFLLSDVPFPGALFTGAVAAVFIFIIFKGRKKHLVEFPRAAMAYKNEHFGNEKNIA